MLHQEKYDILLLCGSLKFGTLILDYFTGDPHIRARILHPESLQRRKTFSPRPDLIIIETIFLSQSTPGLVAHLRSQHPTIPILVLTERYVEDWIDWADKLGRVSVLKVNSDRPKVLGQIHQMLQAC